MRRAWSPLAGALAAAVAAGGCGGGGGDAVHAATAHAVRQVAIRGYAFHPATLAVARGGRVTFVNADSSEHTATARDGGFDTGTLRGGERRTVALRKPGTYTYVCSFHPFMHGVVVVR